MMLRKVFIISAVIASLCAVLAVAVFTQRSFWEWFIPWQVNARQQAGRMKDFGIQGQSRWSLDRIEFEEFKFTWVNSQGRYDIAGKRLEAGDLLNALRKGKAVAVQLTGLGLRSPELVVEDADVGLAWDVSALSDPDLTGRVQIAELKQGDYRLTDISARVTGDLPQVKLTDLQADFLGAQLQGEISLETKEQISYSMHIKIRELDLREMQQFNREIFSKVKGRVIGEIAMSGNDSEVRSLSADFSADQGGQIKASLLSYLMPYIPANSSQRKDLEKLIKADGDVPLNQAEFEIRNISDDALSGRVRLLSERFNLDVDVAVDVNIDGGFKSFIKSQRDLLKSIGGNL